MSKPDAYYQAVAEIHMTCIDRGFLSTLGVDFLALLYRAIEEGENSLLLTEQNGDRIVGFVAASTGMGMIYKKMLRRWPKLVRSLLPVLISPRRLWRVLEILRYSASGPSNSQVALPPCELLSIAVVADARGQGHAESLYRRLCSELRVRSVPAFRIIVGGALGPAHRFYQRMGAQTVGELELHAGEKSVVYVHSLEAAR